MRGKLRDNIDKFHKDALKYIPLACLLSTTSLPAASFQASASWDTLEESTLADAGQQAPAADEGAADDGAITMRPERIVLGLPSNIGLQLCEANSLMRLVKIERRLREGQMNDTLHQIRVHISYKSVLYRTSVRQASSYRLRLRSFDDVHVVNADMLGCARVYEVARGALSRLFRPQITAERLELQQLQEKYQVLHKKELKANTALIEQAVRGVSKAHLPWFWSLGMDKDSKGDGWMAESKCAFCDLCILI